MNSVSIVNQDPKFKFRKKNLTQFSVSVLNKLGFRDKALSLVFLSDPKMKRLNQKYLNHDWFTDVLAFPSSENWYLGEVIISPKRAKIYAKKLGISYHEELARYVCHGILHLKGYSDHSKKKRKIMELKENQLLKMNQSLVARLF